MPSGLRPSRRPVMALFLAVTTLGACERATAPDATRQPDAAALGAASARVGGSDMVPHVIRATFGVAVDAKPITCAPAQAGISVRDKYTGTGNATHAGKVSFTIIFDTCTLVLPPGGSAAWIAEGRSTSTAANGDLIYSTFNLTQFVNGDFVLNSFIITGGTGRFANASGELSGSGYIDRPSLQGYFTFSGLITRPNS